MRWRRMAVIAARCPVGGELDAAVRLVVHEPPVREPLHGGRDRARAQPEPLRERARMGATVAREPVDGFERLAVGF